MLARKGNTVAAITELERSVALQPNLPEAYYQLALLLRRAGKPEQAKQAMARFNELRDATAGERDAVLKQLQDTLR